LFELSGDYDKNCAMKVEDIILDGSAARGMVRLRPFLGSHYCRDAAAAILDIPKKTARPAALVATGFYVGGFPETDGPPGAYFLYRALRKIGFSVKVITDEITSGLFSEIIPVADVVSVPFAISDEKAFVRQICEGVAPSLLCSVERCGRTWDGSYRDMRGNDISAFTAPIDALFMEPSEGCLTLGIGDGGNEIGMGTLKEVIIRELSMDPCVVSVDYLILSEVSNWGAYGLIHCLETQSGVSCLPTNREMVGFLESIVKKGARDGITGKQELSVDGYPIAKELEVCHALVSVSCD
jgi:hypothetical protein